jgi:serine/threonine protein kinase
MVQRYEENDLTNCIKDLDNEIQLLKLFSDYSNSVKYYGKYIRNNEIIIVLEKCDDDLEKYMQKRRRSLTTEKIKEIFTGLNKVFKAMHSGQRDIIHRDLKLSNLLIKYKDNNKNDFIVKLGDYGIGKFLNKNNSISGFKGTSLTAAPEIILKKIQKYDNSVDIFSLGVILYQLSHNLEHPFSDNDLKIIIYNKYYDKDDFNITFNRSIKNKYFIDLVKKMLKLNPKNRLSWKDYFNHPFFK